ncbi:hypothetical protein DEO72_LG11g1626 [Vigna unguiculata]|uniref:Uncharacterized protein n=1 Tax=Vigna unguiculata TaxID=3917 RepID=A0A4D6NLE0_VIGUN|nr:hypothetical protein DEO72_LG11g1626 [Vigna unguiculata]
MNWANTHVLDGLWVGIDVLGMSLVWIGHNSMTLLVRVHGGVSSNGRNSMNLVVRVQGGALSNGRNSMNLVVRVQGGTSSNGRNSMNHSVRVHGGASCFVVVPHDQDVIPQRFRGGASRPGCNSTKVSWWCLIICIWIVES